MLEDIDDTADKIRDMLGWGQQSLIRFLSGLSICPSNSIMFEFNLALKPTRSPFSELI